MPKRDTFYGAVATGGLEGVKKKKKRKCLLTHST